MCGRATVCAVFVFAVYLIVIACKKIDKEEFNFIFTELGAYVNESEQYKKMYYGPTGPYVSWIKTRKICLKFGLKFVHFDNIEEYETFRRILIVRRLGHASVFKYKVGGYRKANRTWYWADTQKPITIDIPWAKGQPDTMNNTKNCLLVARDGDNYPFEVIGCSEKGQSFICEKRRKLKKSKSLMRGK